MKLLLLAIVAGLCFYFGFSKEDLQKRPAFEIINNGVSPIACNLAYKEKREVVKTTNMMLHDYFKKDNGKYYFAVSVGERKFLLGALEVVKSSTAEADLRKAKEFAALCRNFGQPRRVTAVKDLNSLTPKEIAHIKNSVKKRVLEGDKFTQNNRLLDVYKTVKGKFPSKTFQKRVGTFYLIEGSIPKYYSYPTLTVWTSRSVSRNGGESGYCLSYELAYYHAMCQFFERVKKRKYTGPKSLNSKIFH